MIDVPPPCQSTALIGHDQAVADIHAVFDSGRMPHAWLITGMEGIGKTTLAYHMAHLILSGGASRIGKVNAQDTSARLIMAEAHPDMYILRRPIDEKTGAIKDTISAEEARKMVPFFHLTSALGQARFALIDEAHTLNRFGQNAILKMIEEPPPGAVVVLTATTVGSLLPTIRSRCRVVALNPLQPVAMETVLTRLGVDLPGGAEKQRLLTHAGGSVGRAVQLLQSEVLPLLEELIALVAAPDLDVPALHKLGDLVGKKADSESFEVLTSLFTEVLRGSVRAAALGQGDPTGLAPRLAQGGRLDRALDVWEKTVRTFQTAKTANLDNKLALITAVTDIVRGQ